MSWELTPKQCFQCTSEMRHVQLLQPVVYLSNEKKMSILHSYYPHEGRVVAFICDQCGSMRFFGEPLAETK